ncbi:beta-galactosidase BglA [Oryzicola mucosus]|uniref:Alpha-glucosidase n=1 Tax=Oryzicola mucosus TaxID=2767425 RepID=A0A8J6TZC5_9HYPH|nr:alpha-glucosidase family protein [Oryzicola mucosus]MBD0415959.1 alpha-glucosidase [Oryzicola mucosus]
MTDPHDWWRGCVIYQVYPRSFQDTTGDGSGDLVGITERLPYIASLGVDAVWLSPFFKSPMADMGYDVSDYCDVDPMFGTLDDFDRLIAEAHRLGLKIIIDQVLSHTSDQHPWFIESRADRDNPKADWYVWAAPKPDGGPPNNWLSNFGGSAWEWDSVRKQYYLHNFLISQPDLNFHNPEVQAALLETVRFWLDRGVDGFRLDTVNHYIHDRWLRDNPPSAEALAGTIDTTNPYGYQLHLFNKTQPENLVFLQRFRRLLNEYEGRAAVGEVGDEWRSLQTVAAYTSGGDKLQMCYTFDMLGPDFSAGYVHKCVSAFEAMVIDGWYCWAFSNHDVMRHVTRWTRPGEDPKAVARFAIGLMACLRGSVCLYQGEELGLQEAELAFEDLRDPYGIRFWPGFKGRDGCRTPMVWEANAPNAGFSTGKPWLPVLPAQSRQSVNVQQTDPDSVLNHYRAVLAARKQHPALVTGSIDLFEVEDEILAFIRQTGDEKLLCLFNFSDQPVNWIVPSGLSTGEPIAFPGAAGSAELGKVALPPLGIFLSRLS